jgi:quercetin dioxygenase-like cupin family protein
MIKFEQKGPAERNHLPDDPWEAAYVRFETPEQEVRKFIGRLKFMDAMNWRRNTKIVELFCGRGSGLRALHQLGFNQVEGIDLSPSLAAEYAGPGKVLVGDCRQLPFESASKDILIVQGGLHHLPVLPDDLRIIADGLAGKQPERLRLQAVAGHVGELDVRIGQVDADDRPVHGRRALPGPARVGVVEPALQPGARTAWHTHPLGQTLIVTSGYGRVQHWGGPVEDIRPGDVVWFAPGEKHWHGASPTTAMTHIAIQEKLEGKAVEWMEQVSNDQYLADRSAK